MAQEMVQLESYVRMYVGHRYFAAGECEDREGQRGWLLTDLSRM